MHTLMIRQTSDDKLAGGIRLLLAMLFLMTGVMKLVVPMLAEAWSGQLLELALFSELARLPDSRASWWWASC